MIDKLKFMRMHRKIVKANKAVNAAKDSLNVLTDFSGVHVYNPEVIYSLSRWTGESVEWTEIKNKSNRFFVAVEYGGIRYFAIEDSES